MKQSRSVFTTLLILVLLLVPLVASTSPVKAASLSPGQPQQTTPIDPGSLVAFGVPVVVLVIGLVEFCKKLGANGNVCLVLSLFFGILLMLLVQVSEIYPAMAPWIKVLIWGSVAGLTAPGLFDLAKSFRPANPQ
jgi:hypothetical protein